MLDEKDDFLGGHSLFRLVGMCTFRDDGPGKPEGGEGGGKNVPLCLTHQVPRKKEDGRGGEKKEGKKRGGKRGVLRHSMIAVSEREAGGVLPGGATLTASPRQCKKEKRRKKGGKEKKGERPCDEPCHWGLLFSSPRETCNVLPLWEYLDGVFDKESGGKEKGGKKGGKEYVSLSAI